MIIVGLLGASPDSAPVLEIARRAAAAGRKVEVVGLVPGDAGWDAALFDLAQAGAGHATVVRSQRNTMEPADLDLALRYLPDIRAVILVRPPTVLLSTAVAGADFSGAPLVVVGPLEATAAAALDSHGSSRSTAEPIVLDPPDADPEASFAGFVAALAVRLDAGEAPDRAFRATVASLAVDPA